MTTRVAKWMGAFSAGLWLAAGAAMASGIGPLASTEWLAKNLGRPDLVIIDASPGRLYAAGHIPGAVNADVFAFGGREVAPAEMQRRIRSWGVSADRRVVIYDAGGTFLATSIHFDLAYHGFPPERMAVLDGGLAKWKAMGGSVTTEPAPAPAPGTFGVSGPREDIRVRLAEFVTATGDPAHHAVVDALEPAQHFGGMKFFDRAGHVPNAILAPAADFFREDRTFKSPGEIRRMLAHLGIPPEKTMHAHCGGGIAASAPFFAAKWLAGYPAVKLYRESQLEWLRDERGLPFWTYGAPGLVRERDWLAGWGNAMVRSFGVSHVSVIDVRPPEAYRNAHLPFSVNVPAATFRALRGQPTELAKALGAAGVNPEHEAVIVSEGGVNADSALAFVLLERLGQKRVSVLAGSVDDWGFAGHPLVKAEAPDPSKAAPAARPLAYAASPRHGITAAADAPEGVAPRLYVAMGKAVPASAPPGKVVHVPQAGLVKPDGTPKPAMEIWTALAKAGVSRDAEVISFADDPGDAAAGYLLLRLMGFPVARVLSP